MMDSVHLILLWDEVPGTRLEGNMLSTNTINEARLWKS